MTAAGYRGPWPEPACRRPSAVRQPVVYGPGGQWVSLLGASGAGKTSLLRVMAGLAPATRGEVVASDGQPIQGRLAWMGQKDLLYPWLSVRDNVALGARLRGEKVDRARVAALLEQVELSSCADARPATSPAACVSAPRWRARCMRIAPSC
ncbi:ABC transporter ATP-binding protein [Klebsiella pneumoniae]|uniref:ABC transporter ATP-binding protein n=1 Tax=Klebsiella pneumoniae TaxID=573 RepID=A0A377WIC7_KLEPN|nr:ABC transporter ATP-binding protein [Klebsiella pneumoniae]